LPPAERILIVSQTFPPYNGIGGRRWAKLAKYLCKAGIEIEVICADLGRDKTSPWTEDVNGVPVFTYEHSFPKILEQFPKSLFDKLNYRLQVARLKKISKGTPYDRALLDRDSFLKTFYRRLREFKPHTVVVTGAPFYLLHYALEAKAEFSDIFFVADFRDPWTWGNSYGYSKLSEKRLLHEKALEENVVAKYNMVLSPWPSLVNRLQEIYAKFSGKIKLLEHGYDPDDFTIGTAEFENESFDVIFGGTIYQGMERSLEKIIFQFNQDLRLGIFSNDLHKLRPNAKSVHSGDLISSKDFLNKVAQSKAVLMLIPFHMKDGIPSKLFEYAYVSTPIIAIGHKGSLAEFIETNQFGIFLEDESQLLEVMIKLPDLEKNDEVLLNYNFEHLTKKLLSFF